MLKRNFDRAYNGNTRAPFGLYVHAAWFFGYEFRYEGYKMFLEDISSKDDVWIVPITVGIEYRKNPVSNDELMNGTLSDYFGCLNYPPENCQPQSCKYEDVHNEDMDGSEEYITTCDFCPDNYPWIRNPEGL